MGINVILRLMWSPFLEIEKIRLSSNSGGVLDDDQIVLVTIQHTPPLDGD